MLKRTQAEREYELRSFESQASDGRVPEEIELEDCTNACDLTAHAFTLIIILAKVIKSRPAVARKILSHHSMLGSQSDNHVPFRTRLIF